MENLQNKLARAFQYFDTHQYDKAEQLYNECFAFLKSEQLDQYKQALHGMGYVKCGLKKFDEARKMYRTLKVIAQQEKNVIEMVMAMHQLGMVERMAENYLEALRIFDEERQMLEQFNIQQPLYLAANYYEVGNIALLQHEFEKAEQYLNLSLHYAEVSEDLVCIGCAYRGLGELYVQLENKAQANHYFKKAKKLFLEMEDLQGVKEINEQMNTLSKY